ncbi:MAG: TIGR03545 family protein [Bdellovibrionaceae bacterium]|nr:TIGR03545 family protein [Pseudobdellovibrionaceae bacterium]
MTTKQDTPKTPKTPKKKGPIRWEAIIPFAIVVGLTWAYFFFLFDSHLRWAMETGGYQVLGAEVNVGKVETSFWNASLRIQNVQCTDPEKPAFNMIEVGDIRFGMLWDALLRAKVVVNEMAVEGIKVGTPRRHPGRVKPPEPVDPKAPGEPSAMEKEADKLKKQAIQKAQEEYSENVLGDIAAMLSGTSSQDQLKNIEGTLLSKQQMADFQKNLEEKNKAWQERLKTLPKPAEVQALQDRLNKVKTSDFKTPQELADSVKQFEEIFKEADAKAKSVQSASNDMNGDLKAFETGLRDIEAQIKKDVSSLEARFRLPKLDAKAISRSLFKQYMDPYLAKLNRFRSVVQKYAPPNVMKKGEKEPEVAMQPRPRTKGVSYEFGRPNSYPLFWAKKISVSSKAGSEPGAGDIAGLITDLTTHQVLIGKPTVAKFTGNFPNDGIQDILAQLSLDNTKEASVVAFDFNVGAYPINGREVVNSPDVKLAFQNAAGSMKSRGTLIGLKELTFKLENKMNQVKYDVAAKNETVQEILMGVFNGIPTVTVDADVAGTLPEMAVEVQSNLGYEIQKGFEKQIQAKINEAKAKIQAYVNEQIGAEKAKIDAEVAKLKNQGEAEVKKVQTQLEAQKAQAQAKVDQAKKDFENQAQAAAKKEEEKAKAGVKKEAEKAAEDLKKKLGW